MIVECKFIGSGAAAEATARWREVYTNLWSNLQELHSDPTKGLNSPYRHWLDPVRPVMRYSFCVTATMTDRELATLEARISEDFSALVDAGVEPLRSLVENVDGGVQVLRWDWFDAALNEHPSLAFRWFRSLPVGIELLEDARARIGNFRDFLNGGQLPYFSRDRYEAEGAGKLPQSEAELVAGLAGGLHKALLIVGAGGVGKTRLSWELASKLADADQPFDTFLVNRSVNFDSIAELAARYPADARILLLVDYAEAVPRLVEVADAITHISDNSGHIIRLIATCRASATNQVRDSLAGLDPELKSLGSHQSGEDAFLRWVTRSILALVPSRQREDLERVCHGIPALAAFALFLSRHHPEQFDNQFGALHGIDDFEKWANHRIALLIARLGDRVSTERMLARVALALPLPHDHFTAMHATHGSLLDAIRADRWIEPQDGYYFAAHDVLADALAARWLFEVDHVVTERIIDLLGEAAQNGDLSHALTVLGRLASHPKFGEIDGMALANALLVRFPDQVRESSGVLVGGPLLNFEEKLELLHRSALFSTSAPRGAMLNLSLSMLADEAAYRKLDPATSPALATLSDFLDEVCRQPHPSNIILRRAYAFDSPRFRERAFANIAVYAYEEPTHFLLVQMLRSGEPPENLGEQVMRWLSENARAPRASFLYAAWLDAGGGPGTISAAFLEWVGVHGTALSAQFVYKAWLDEGGDLEPVSAVLLAWVGAHGDSPEARFVYQPWLDAGGSLEAISAALLAWVGAYGAMSATSHVYKAWLDAGGDPEPVSAALLEWVGAHGNSPEARFVYQAWLDAGGERDAISSALLAWIDAHGTALEAPFSYEAWLDAGGDLHAISAALLAWVGVHGTERVASHVYKTWLDAGGDCEAVSVALLAWVAEHGVTFEADFVYRSWLDAGGEFSVIQDQVYRWVLRWYETPDFVFMCKALSKRADLPQPVVLAIARWCAVFPSHEDCLYRLSSLLSRLGTESFDAIGAGALVRCVDAVVEAQREFSPLVRTQLWAICISLGRAPLFNLNPYGIARTVAAVVASNMVFRKDLEVGPISGLAQTHEAMTQLVLNCLRQGTLSVEHDGAPLLSFAEWLRETAAEPARLLTRLNNAFPNAIWTEVRSLR